MTFYNYATPIGTQQVNQQGIATLTTSTLPAFYSNLYAKYLGNSNCKTSMSGPYLEDVVPPAGVIDPLYHVTSIIYAPPGDKSVNSYTNSATDGTTTSITKSLTTGSSLTFNTGGPFFSEGYTFGATRTTGDTTSFTTTFTDATGIGNANGGSTNAISHLQDLFVIWLNPEVTVQATNPTTASYDVATQNSEQVCQVEVVGSVMASNSVPIEILKMQWDVLTGQYDLPGLASICANQTEYANDCPNGTPCGCVVQDFAPILAEDSLLYYSPTENPMNANTSSIADCSNPSPTASCRYVPVPSTPQGTTQEVEWLSGPDCQGCDLIPNAFTQTDSNQKTQTLTETWAETVAETTEIALFDGGPTLRTNGSWTWTQSESTGAINGTANSMAVTLESATPGCWEEIPIFEDTLFHTFVYMQPTGNNSCP